MCSLGSRKSNEQVVVVVEEEEDQQYMCFVQGTLKIEEDMFGYSDLMTVSTVFRQVSVFESQYHSSLACFPQF